MIKILIILLLLASPCYAAELLVKVGKSGGYEDGDIIHAFNDERILNVHAQHICHPKYAEMTDNGLRQPGSLLEDYLKNSKQYKFERVSKRVIKRIDLKTLDEDLISDVPNKDGEYMDVPVYIKRRLKHNRHQIFGVPGREYWYGGNTIITKTKLDKIWVEIESKSNYKKSDHTLFPFKWKELAEYYVITVDDFSDEERGELTSPKLGIAVGEEPAPVLKARKHKVDYKNIGLSVNDKENIQNRRMRVDHRKTKSFQRANIVETK